MFQNPLAIGLDHVPLQRQMKVTGLQNVTLKDAFTGENSVNGSFMGADLKFEIHQNFREENPNRI